MWITGVDNDKNTHDENQNHHQKPTDHFWSWIGFFEQPLNTQKHRDRQQGFWLSKVSRGG